MERIDKLKEFLAANPEDSFLNHALALEHLKMNDSAGARTIFEDLLARDPGYVGSYYQLGKILESSGETNAAISWYQKGMEAARKAADQHALNELQAAYEDLIY
jgi:Tfp pilus assembly protein PilF